MSEIPKFNYIITIHNKEQLIEQVLMCVLMCCRDNSHIYPVLDGCTDKTEEIIDSIIEKFANIPITKVYTPDVHELLSINAGLKAANQEGIGYNIVLQDDVLLADFLLEKKVAALYDWAGDDLGYVSFRLGANFTKDAALSTDIVPLTDVVENAYGHGLAEADVLLPGYMAYRTVPIKSPVCIPFKLVQSIGLLEERLAPYAHDDTDYAIRCIQAGFRNAVFAVRFYSDVKWGGTRISPHPEILKIQERNIQRIREWHSSELSKICQSHQSTEIHKIPSMVSKDDEILALQIWEQNRKQLELFQQTQKYHVSNIIRKIFKGILKN